MRKLTNNFPIVAIAFMLFMFGCDQINSPNPETGIDVTSDVSEAEAHAGNIVYVDATNSGAEDGSQSNPFNTIQEGVDHSNDDDVVVLLSDFTLSNQVTISTPLTLDGSGNTVFSSFAKTDNDNNAAIGILGASGVTVSNLYIDGAGGTNLHGINVYESVGVLVSDISIKDNDRTGLVVNGSEVTAHNISTAGHGWHAINVAQGGGVTDPAVLTVTGSSTHAEAYPPTPHIYIDDISQDASVNDVEGQYDSEEFANPNIDATARAYFLAVPETKNDCKKGGWQDYGFKNQGQCIRYVNTEQDSR